jgi:hypothetical protein
VTKISPERLAELRSVGYLKSGPTRHNDAGVPIKKVKDTGDHRSTIDANDSIVTEHKDGSTDLVLNPQPVKASMKNALGG